MSLASRSFFNLSTSISSFFSACAEEGPSAWRTLACARLELTESISRWMDVSEVSTKTWPDLTLSPALKLTAESMPKLRVRTMTSLTGSTSTVP